ncbi:hypothetical protein F5B21DRAFT_518347 [Xylaria acuta]|nr:hypothetical protein F5B21DRAFT_518347 [Xylaria acuta]
MAAAGADVGYLATHLGMPEANLATAASEPTVDLVNAILAAVATKSHEFDVLFSQKLQLEVELETSVRGAEAQRDASNETAKKALKDVEDIRQKLNQEETKRQTLENELQSLKSSSSTSQSDSDSLRARIASLETSNRESLAIIDTKNATNETLSQELQAQHQKNLKLSQEVTSLQQAVQNASATASSAKIREQGLQRQLEAVKRDIEWTDQELKKKTAEALSYRKEKGARIAELQRQNDDAASTVESLKRGEQQLRQRLQDAQNKADAALAKVQQLEEAAARREEDFQQQVGRLQRLHELTEQQNTTQKNRLQAMEEREAQVKRECEDRVQQISKELASLNMDKEELAQANESLQAEVGRLEAMIASGSGGSPGQPGSAPQTPRPLNGSMYRPSSPFATPGSMRRSISATQALEEYYKRSSRLAKDLEDLEELYAENERLQSEIKNMKAENAASQAQAEIAILRNQLRDLGAQIQMLLFNMHCQEKGLDELSIEETMILQRLVNEKLLQVTHELGQNMETVEDHKERIRLQQELDIKTESITKERDMFRRIVDIEQNPPMDGDGFDYATLLEEIRKETLKEQIEKLINSQLSLTSGRFEIYRTNYAALENENKELQRRSQTMSESAAKQDIRTQNVAEELVEARAVAEKNLWQDIQNRLSRDNENLIQEKSRLNKLADAETKRRVQATIDTLETDLTSTKRKLAEEQSQKRIDELTANLGQIREELVAVKTSRDHLQSRERAERLQPRPTPRPGSMQDSDERIQELIYEATDLKRDLEITKSQLENAEGQELERLNSAQEQYIQEMENALSTKDTTIKELERRLSILRDSQAEVTRRFEEEKGILEEEDIRAQAEIATTAQQAYENELKTSATLMQSESSWDERRQKFEQEISEIRTRWEDANAQNKLLHQQLEGVNAQITALQTISAQPSDPGADKYRELSNYLRREKDILEVQLELKLDEARLKLEQERRSQSDNDRNTMAHKDLMSKLEELNLFRESKKIAKIAQLDQQNFKEAEMKQIQEDRDRWQKHPAEVEELKQKELEKSIATKEADWAVTREKLITSAKERSRQLTTVKNQNFEEELETFKKAKSELEEQVLEFKKQVSSLQATVENAATPAAPSELQTSQLNSALSGKVRTGAEAHTQTNGDTTMENSIMTTSQPLSDDERKKLEEQIAASEARAAEWEAKAKELEQNQDTIVKHRSDKMKEALNKRLSEFKASMESERAQLQQDKERLEADFKLRMEQERKIWETEQATGQSGTMAPSTPQHPKPEAPVATPNTPMADLNNLGDQEIRELVSRNATVRSIVQNNIKSKLAVEAKKIKEEHEASIKADWEQKLVQAKESATQLVTSKMNLKLNMTENRARMANAKIEVVQTAARETPQRPVGEVWLIAKDAKPPPVPKQPAPAATPATPATPAGPAASTATPAPTSQPTPSKPPPVSQEAKSTPSTIPPKPAAPNAPQLANNPFGASQQNQAPQLPMAANPFAQTGLPTPQQTAPSGIPQPAQSSISQIPKASNLPIPGGARKPSGPQIPRGGARGGGPQRGRGGHQGRTSLNPSADMFQPGAKRPRGDSEVGNGPKRARGGGPGS